MQSLEHANSGSLVYLEQSEATAKPPFQLRNQPAINSGGDPATGRHYLPVLAILRLLIGK